MRRVALAAALLAVACGGTTPAATSAPGVGASAASATPNAPPTKIVVTYGSIAADVLPTYVALEGGFFARNGLDVDLQLISSSNAAVAALVSGKADFTQAGASEAISAAVSGADISIVALTSPTYSYILEAAPGIKTPADLKGKKVGIDPDKDVSIVPIGGVPERTAAMQSGAIQATVANPPETLALEKAGFNPILDLASLKLPAAVQATIVRKETVTGKPDLVQRFVDSLVQALALMRKDKKVAVEALKKYFKSTDDEGMAKTVEFYVTEVFPANPAPRLELFGDAVATLAARNERVKTFDLAKLIDPSFANKAIDRGLHN